jgi:hypothetical protein
MDVEARWLTTAGQAERLSSGIARWLEFADYSYRFETDVALTLGDTYTLEETAVLSVSTDVRIVEIREGEQGYLSVVAEGMDEYTVVAPDRDDAVTSPAAGNEARAEAEWRAALDDDGSPPYEGWDAIPTGGEYFDLRQPDCRSHLGREPTDKEIVFLPGKFKDELGTEYDNLWSKFTGLGTIGCFKATTNLIVDPEDMTTTAWNRASGVTVAASDYTIQGRKFTQLTKPWGSVSYYKGQDVSGLTIATPSLTFTLKNGNVPSGERTQIVIWDFTTSAVRLGVYVYWGTQVVEISTAGTLVSAKWIADDMVEVSAIASGLVTGNTNALLYYPNNSVVDAAVIYVTASQVENSAYPTPYTPTSRATGVLKFGRTPAGEDTIECWVYPWFPYDDGSSHIIWHIGQSGAITNAIALFYEQTDDKFRARMYLSAGNGRYAASTDAFVDNATLRQWHHLKVVYSIADQTLALYQDGVLQTDNSSSGDVSTLDPDPYLHIGSRAGLYPFDGLITDLCIWGSEDESTTHYDNGVPYYDPGEVANAVQSVRISKRGIRMHGASISQTDDYGRYMGIGPREGFLAKDAAGKVLHDLPRLPLLDGMTAQEHYYKFDFDNATYTLLNSTTFTEASWITLTAVTRGHPNVRGVKVKVYLYGLGAATTIALTYIALRPTGSGWVAGYPGEVTPDDLFRLVASGNYLGCIYREAVLEVPVDANYQFDIYASVDPSGTARQLYVQQLGIIV